MLSFYTSAQTPKMQERMLANVHQQVHKEHTNAAGFPLKKLDTKVTRGRKYTGLN